MTGDEADNDPDAGNPVKIGGRVSIGEPTLGAEDDRVNAWFDEHGRLTTRRSSDIAIEGRQSRPTHLRIL